MPCIPCKYLSEFQFLPVEDAYFQQSLPGHLHASAGKSRLLSSPDLLLHACKSGSFMVKPVRLLSHDQLLAPDLDLILLLGVRRYCSGVSPGGLSMKRTGLSPATLP